MEDLSVEEVETAHGDDTPWYVRLLSSLLEHILLLLNNIQVEVAYHVIKTHTSCDQRQ